MFGKNNSDKLNQLLDPFYVNALLLAEVVKRILDLKASMQMSKVSGFEIKPVTEFMRKMRVSSLDKFDSATYVSVINYFKNLDDMEKHKAVGTLVVYVEEEFIGDLLRKLDYPISEDDEDDEKLLLDGVGTMCNLIAGNFKSGLTQLGYQELEMSHFISFRNEILNGVDYCLEQDKKYEISFEIKGKKRIVTELNLGSVPKAEH